jgi:RNA polymerase sigma factor (sigma-70 family)
MADKYALHCIEPSTAAADQRDPVFRYRGDDAKRRFEGFMSAMIHPPRTTAADDASQGVKEATLSFEEFVEREGPRLFRAPYLVTGSRHEAEEVMQDAFVALWERWERIAGIEDPTGYLYRTAMNIWRKRVRRAALMVRKAIHVAPNEDPFEAVDRRDQVFRALARLHPNQRAAIVVTSLLGYSSDDAGAMLGMTPAVVRMHASRGRAALHDEIGEL